MEARKARATVMTIVREIRAALELIIRLAPARKGRTRVLLALADNTRLLDEHGRQALSRRRAGR